MAFEDPTQHPVRVVADALAAGGIVATFIGWLPSISAILGFVWFIIQIWESRTVQDGVARWQKRKLRKLKAKMIIYESKVAAAEAEELRRVTAQAALEMLAREAPQEQNRNI